MNLFTLMSLMSCPNKWFGKLFHSLIILTKKEYLKALILAAFVEQLQCLIPEYKKKYSNLADKGLFWDMIKMEIRGFCVRFSKRKSRMRRNIEKNLSDQIDALMKTLVTNRSKENIAKLYNLR